MKKLTEGNLLRHLIRLSLPSIGGMFAFAMFNITDTYFVGKLGTEALAAMGFTFPVVMIAGAISSGISTGAASLISRAAGNGDRETMKRTATDGILLSVVIVALFSSLGLLTMDLLFPLLGASPETLPLVKEYMGVWYAFVIVVMLPPIGDSAMRSVGDTLSPFVVMLTCALLNIVLDPIFIFGWFGFPALGVRGAAIATVLSRAVGMVITLAFNHYKHGLLDFKMPSPSALKHSWSQILIIGVPSMGVSLMPQLVRMGLTTLAAYTAGTVGVAAIAAGSRIEGFMLMLSSAIGISIIPLVGQNYGAKQFERLKAIRKLLNQTAFLVGALVFLLMLVFAEPVVKWFSKDPEVIKMAAWYLRIMAFSASGLNLYTFTNQTLNALGRSSDALKINTIGTLIILLPMMFVGSRLSFVALLLGLGLGQMILGGISMVYGNQKIETLADGLS